MGWTSSNFVTALDSFGGSRLVTQSGNAYTGDEYAIQLTTGPVHLPAGLISLPISTITLPGFALNGIFSLGPKTFTSSSQINPGTVPGAGQPFSQRLATINGYYNYTPVLDSNTHANDTCVIWAVLRKGTTIIANAIFKSTLATDGYSPFSANFEYISCDLPDTLVVFLSSSAPNVLTFIPGSSSSLEAGSTLLIDGLGYDTLAADYTFAPFARNDLFDVYEDHTDTLDVLENDTDCSGQPLVVTIISGPSHGTASVLSNNSIQYTSTIGYWGLDSIFYRDKNISNDTATALCQIYVAQNTGIASLSQIALNLHPVPASNELNIQFENPGRCTGRVYDLVGNLVLTTTLNNNNNQLNIESLANGIYSVEILNAQNTVIGRSKFVVAK